jgi:hypothetical protein
MRTFEALILLPLILLSIGCGFDVSPTNPNPGDRITLNGMASPDEQVSLRSSFSMDLPVTAGQYEYATRVDIPQKPNRFTVTAKNVQDFNAGVKLGIWITKGFPASSGMARISQADVPPGEYDLKMFGNALPGSSVIPVTVEAETLVMADSEGKYVLDIDTSGIPAGEYRIEAAGVTKTIQIGSKSSSSRSASIAKDDDDDTKAVDFKPTEKPVEITPYVVRWYANYTGLRIENSSQYDEAEELLKKRLKGGYWKIISKGDPLTEEAGDCQQEYCLVRGADACTICREKDKILNPEKSSQKPKGGPLNGSEIGGPESNPPQKNLISRLLEWIWQFFLKGGG